jgi:hypothetical protein
MSSDSLYSTYQRANEAAQRSVDSPVLVALLALNERQAETCNPLSHCASSGCPSPSTSEKICLSPTPFALTTASLHRTRLFGDSYNDRFGYRTVRRDAQRGQMDQSAMRQGTREVSIDSGAFKSVNDVAQINQTTCVGNDTGNSFVLRPPAGTLFISQ